MQSQGRMGGISRRDRSGACLVNWGAGQIRFGSCSCAKAEVNT